MNRPSRPCTGSSRRRSASAAADVEILGSTRGWLRYRLPERYVRRDTVPLCIGQKQRWFLLRLLAAQGTPAA